MPALAMEVTYAWSASGTEYGEWNFHGLSERTSHFSATNNCLQLQIIAINGREKYGFFLKNVKLLFNISYWFHFFLKDHVCLPPRWHSKFFIPYLYMTSPHRELARVTQQQTYLLIEPRPTSEACEWYTHAGPCASQGLMFG